jgi:hypothetical protein
MIKRILTIAFITGAGQLFIIFSLKYISHHNSPAQIKEIGQIDSLVLFMMNVIAFGLQPAAMRNLALAKEWKDEFVTIQSARVVFGLLLALLTLLSVTDPLYLSFLIAPLLALSGDYAVYARGFPVVGSMIALIRSVIPFLLVVLLSRFQSSELAFIYLAGLILAYLITNSAIIFFLKTRLIPRLKFKNLLLYLQTFPLGLVSLSLYFIGLGVIPVSSYFYSTLIIATAFTGLKFYVIYKGLLRILHQAFFKDMTDENLCLKIDQLSAIAGIIFLGSFLFFPVSIIRFVFGKNYLQENIFFLLLATAGFLYSLFLSMSTRSMLLKKDRVYMKVSVTAALITLVLSITLVYVWENAAVIAISILVGELFWLVGLIRIAGTGKDIRQRLFFTLQNIFFLFIPFGVRLAMGDSLPAYSIGFGMYGAVLFLLHHRKFGKLPSAIDGY